MYCTAELNSQIIGDAENPIEFEPNAADLAHVTGGAEAFAKAKAEATVAFGSCTVAKCIAAVSNSALLSSKLASFVAAAAFEGTASVAALCTSKKLDLGLDNKWTAGRFNPIVFGMAAMGSGCLDNPTMLQLKHASSKPGRCANRTVPFSLYASYCICFMLSMRCFLNDVLYGSRIVLYASCFLRVLIC